MSGNDLLPKGTQCHQRKKLIYEGLSRERIDTCSYRHFKLFQWFDQHILLKQNWSWKTNPKSVS